MAISGSVEPEDRLGGNVVMTISEPNCWLLLRTYTHQVKIELAKVREFADSFDYVEARHTSLTRFTFEQERALIHSGYAVIGGGGSLRPTMSLVNDIAEWTERHR
jgi:hypothetical protein